MIDSISFFKFGVRWSIVAAPTVPQLDPVTFQEMESDVLVRLVILKETVGSKIAELSFASPLM